MVVTVATHDKRFHVAESLTRIYLMDYVNLAKGHSRIFTAQNFASLTTARISYSIGMVYIMSNSCC